MGGGAQDSADTCHLLSPAEQANFTCIMILATQGYCPGDLVLSQGVWSLGRGSGAPAPVLGEALEAAQLKVENEIQTLYIRVHPYAQLTAS